MHFLADNGTFQASFRTLQPTIAALIFRAVHKIGETALCDHTSKKLSVGRRALTTRPPTTDVVCHGLV